MTSYLESISKQSKSAAAIIHKFRLSSAPTGSVHIFFEGYDDVNFYGRMIDFVSKQDSFTWVRHISFGKKNMDEVISFFSNSDLKNRKVIFVRDSDFDNFLGKLPIGEEVFPTCGYAVENYVCTQNSVGNFLAYGFGLSKEEVNIDKLVDQFKDTVSSLFLNLEKFIGAIIFAKRSGKYLDLDKVDISKQVRKILLSKDPGDFSEKELMDCGLSAEDFNEESAKIGKKFCQQDPLMWIRGKYLLRATTIFLEQVGNEMLKLHKSKSISNFNRSANSNYNDSSIFDRLCGHAAPVENLRLKLSEIVAQPT